MHVHIVPNRNSAPAVLLRDSVREGGKVKKKTLANLSGWDPLRVEALRRALAGDFDGVGDVTGLGEVESGQIFGVLFALHQLAVRCGLDKVLKGPTGRLALFLVLARVAHQGSRLSAVRWARDHAVKEVLGLDAFDEDDLYDALDWLCEQQEAIDDRLYRDYVKTHAAPPALVLYDVTSSYFEGQHNALSAYGYNRDGKRGKKQIVIGLLTAADGHPLAIKVFEGNTADPSTVQSQIEVLKTRFRIESVVFVGDRGMVKTKGQQALTEAGFQYITALTDPQVRTLLKNSVLTPELFDELLCEVEHDAKRLIVRRNPEMQRKEAHRRMDKLRVLSEKITARNSYQAAHPKARPEAGLRQLSAWMTRHKLHRMVTLRTDAHQGIVMDLDEVALKDVALLDGCYVLVTNVPLDVLDTKTIHDRYQDLQKVERDFRAMKTSLLEIRPIFVTKASRTRGHVFVAMLALLITRHAQATLKSAFGSTEQNKDAFTLEDALSSLARLTFYQTHVGRVTVQRLVSPDPTQQNILRAFGLTWPSPRNKSVPQKH